MTSKKNEQKIHLPPRGLPNRSRPGGDEIPAAAAILEHFLSRFGDSSSDRVLNALNRAKSLAREAAVLGAIFWRPTASYHYDL